MSLREAHKSAEAYDTYGRDLSNALNLSGWVHDPSYALGQDPDVYSKVIRDPVVAHAIRYRQHLAAGLEWRLEPASEESEADAKAVEIMHALLSCIEGFTDARIRQSKAIFRGSAYQFIQGRWEWRRVCREGGSWWVPKALRDVDRRRFRLGPAPDKSGLVWYFWSWVREIWEPLEHPEWLLRTVFDNSEDALGYGRGLLDTLFRFQALKSQKMQKLGRACGRAAGGIAIGKVSSTSERGGVKGGPTRGGDERAAKLREVWKRAEGDDMITIDADDEVSILTGLGEGWQIIMDAIGYFDVNSVTAVLGSSLATMQSTGDTGSYALAKEHGNSTETLSQADRARLSEDVTRDVLGLVWRLNYTAIQTMAPGAEMPRFAIGQQKQDDPTVGAQLVQILRAAGVPLLKSEVYGKTGFSVPGPDEEVIDGPAPAQAPGAATDPLGGLFAAAKETA